MASGATALVRATIWRIRSTVIHGLHAWISARTASLELEPRRPPRRRKAIARHSETKWLCQSIAAELADTGRERDQPFEHLPA